MCGASAPSVRVQTGAAQAGSDMTHELVTDVRAASTEPVRAPEDRRARRGPAPALVVYGLVVVTAFICYVVLARRLWFYRDDFEFLAGRELTLHDLLRPHGGHMTALHLLVYRLMFAVIGLRSYLPYQLLSIGLHLTVATLSLVVMRKARVNDWIAVAAASLFVFFGSGGQDIIWGFQIEFSGAVALGMTQMLLASHDGELQRRDWIGLLAGLLALMCSGVAIAMVGVVALATFIRRGWRPAAFHVLPLAALFGAWWLRYAGESLVRWDASLLSQWLRRGVAGVFDALGQVPFVGWLLAAMLVAGMALAWRDATPAQRRARLAMPTAMLVGAFAFELLTGLNRSVFGVRFATSSRYMHITAALLIPALGVAANALYRRWRLFGPVAVVLLVVGIPGNLGQTTTSFLSEQYYDRYEQMVRSVPRMSLARAVPRHVRVELVNAPYITVGWLLDNAKSGRIPAPSHPLTPQDRLTNELRLGLDQIDGTRGTGCVPLRQPMRRELRKGDAFVVFGTVDVRLIDRQTGLLSRPVSYGSTFLVPKAVHTLRDVAGPMTVQIVAKTPATTICRPAS
jgi:hypothetical protein